MTNCNETQSAPLEPLRIADIADKLDPDVQAELKAAFVQMQRVGTALEAALVRRAALMEALAARAEAGHPQT